MAHVPKTLVGTLTTTQQSIYKTPRGRWAILVAGEFFNTSASTPQQLDIYVVPPGEGSFVIERDGSLAAQTSLSLTNRRWLLPELTSLEAKENTGGVINYMICVLEFVA